MLDKVDSFGLSEAQRLLQIRASPDFMKFLDESRFIRDFSHNIERDL